MRWMLIVVALVISAAVAGPVQAQQISAEKLFQQVEKKLHDAKTIGFGFDIKISGGGKEMGAAKGKLLLGEGDRVRLEGDGFEWKDTTVVADGTKMFIKESGTEGIDSMNSPKNVGAYFRGSLVRVGLLAASDAGLKNDPPPKAAEVFAVSNFKIGAKEKVKGVDTQFIEYKVAPRGSNTICTTKMWVAVKTSLPVKLEFRFEAMGGIVEFSESYTDWLLDAKLDPKLFQALQ